MAEIWDAFYADGKLAGQDIVRGEPIPHGLYHLVVAIIVQHTDGSLLLMQRDLNKPSYPGYYECSAGGAAQKGETPEQAAVRELYEETGICAEKLTEIYRSRNHAGQALHYTYYCRTDCPKDSILLQEGETIGYLWAKKAEYLAMKEKIVSWRRVLNLVERNVKR